MSVRAYLRIQEPKTADKPSFNLWHHTELYEFIMNYRDTIDGLNNDGVGTITVSRDCLEAVINKLETGGFKTTNVLESADEFIRQFREDLRKALYTDSVTYECL